MKKDLLNRSMFFDEIACDLKIWIYKVNSPYKKYVYSLELFPVIFRK